MPSSLRIWIELKGQGRVDGVTRDVKEGRMSNTPNQLDEDFPDMAERIHALKTSDNHFARLVEEYHELNRDIHRIETRVEPASEDYEEELKRRRLRLKDEIAQMLQGEEKTAGEASPHNVERMESPRLRGGM
jgi:uncharacterized protein YdcH (DUF465 family)